MFYRNDAHHKNFQNNIVICQLFELIIKIDKKGRNDYSNYSQIYNEEIKENEYYNQQQQSSGDGRSPLKCVMNPKGKVQDLNSLRRQGFVEAPMLSPEICAEVVNALHAPRGKGLKIQYVPFFSIQKCSSLFYAACMLLISFMLFP